MKTPINLENTSFDMKLMVSKLEMSSFCLFDGTSHKLVKTTDFGTLFVGGSIEQASWLAEETPQAPVLACPETWRMPNVLKALGAFESTSQARKNGWDLDIPEGIAFHSLRINKVKGILVTMKIQ